MKKLKIVSLLAGIAIVLSACSDQEEQTESKVKTDEVEKQQETKVVEQNVTDKSETVSKDEDIQKEIESEKGVSQVSLIITEDAGGFVILDFEVETGMEKQQATQITEKYAKKLKEKYKDSTVDAQARKAGETFAQVTLEKK